MTDVLLLNTNDGGEMEIKNGVVTMSDGLENVVHLSLFGGNEDDSGSEAAKPKQWWANFGELDPARHLRSAFQFLVRSIPCTSGNLRLVQEAAESDLAWMLESIATSVSVLCSIPALNTLKTEVNLVVNGTLYPFTFTTAWGARAQV